MNQLVLLVLGAIAVSCNLASAGEVSDACQLAMMPGQAAMQSMKDKGCPECIKTWWDKAPKDFPKSMDEASNYMQSVIQYFTEGFEGMKECLESVANEHMETVVKTFEGMKSASEGPCQETMMKVMGETFEDSKAAFEDGCKASFMEVHKKFAEKC